MKFIKLYESFDDIDSICKKFFIKNYTINSDGLVDVDGEVDLYNKDLTKLPLKFGNVTGYFHCGYNQLTTLEGCPKSVGGDFACYYNKLTSLEFCPQSVGRSFLCNNNQLTTLEGCPQSVGVSFHCSNNLLKDLYGFPEFFDGIIYHKHTTVSEILNLFEQDDHKQFILGKFIDLLNEYGVIQQNGKVVILDRLEEVFHTLNMSNNIPKEINLKNYEVY